MADYLTPGLLDAIENKFLAEQDHRKLSWMERAKYNIEVMKFRDALRLSDEREREERAKLRKRRERQFSKTRYIMMRQRHLTWGEIVQDFRRQYAAIPKDDKEAQQKFILTMYKSYYFPDTLIGDITNRPAKVVSLMIEDWTFESQNLKG